jgi:hypothetical protein
MDLDSISKDLLETTSNHFHFMKTAQLISHHTHNISGIFKFKKILPASSASDAPQPLSCSSATIMEDTTSADGAMVVPNFPKQRLKKNYYK